jgi:hypothetical protein
MRHGCGLDRLGATSLNFLLDSALPSLGWCCGYPTFLDTTGVPSSSSRHDPAPSTEAAVFDGLLALLASPLPRVWQSVGVGLAEPLRTTDSHKHPYNAGAQQITQVQLCWWLSPASLTLQLVRH